MSEYRKRRPVLRWAAFFALILVVASAVWQILEDPDSPVPTGWNPLRPLDVTSAYSPLTDWKLERALASDAACLAALETGAGAQQLADFTKSAQCHIRPQVSLSRVGDAKLTPFKTRCQTALRMAMWERHGIQTAAQRNLGQGVRQIKHFSSYNCRAIRTSSGSTGRMSTHATADAIDISGFVLEDGRQISLLKGWDGAPADAAFLRDVRDAACEWFKVTLGPDYNALHADHFHLQHTGWGLCR